jgi:hypothetical protein
MEHFCSRVPRSADIIVGMFLRRWTRASPLDHRPGGRHSGLPIPNCACAAGTENSTQGFFVQTEPFDHLITFGD